MVCASVRQGEEEDLQRPGADHTGQEAQDVQFLRMEGPQDCVQEVSEVLAVISLHSLCLQYALHSWTNMCRCILLFLTFSDLCLII